MGSIIYLLKHILRFNVCGLVHACTLALSSPFWVSMQIFFEQVLCKMPRLH